MASNDLIQLTRKELNDLITLSLNDILKKNLDQVINLYLYKLNVCTSFTDVPLNYKSSITIIGTTQFSKPSPNPKNNKTGVNVLEYFNLISNQDALTNQFTQLTSIKIASYISKIVTVQSKFIVLRYTLLDGIKILFDFMKNFATPGKYGIIFKLYKNEKEGEKYSHNGHTVSLIKDDTFYFVDIDNSISQKIDIHNYYSIQFNSLYPIEQYSYMDIIYTLRENFEPERPCELFHQKTNIVTEYETSQTSQPLTLFQAPQPSQNSFFQTPQQPPLFQVPQQTVQQPLFQAPPQNAPQQTQAPLFQAPQQNAPQQQTQAPLFQAPQQNVQRPPLFQAPQPSQNTFFQQPSQNTFFQQPQQTQQTQQSQFNFTNFQNQPTQFKPFGK
jgi:hypothetical protein